MAKRITAPYGSWKSPITADLITAKSIAVGQMAIDGQDIYWIEGRPLEGGRNALVRLTPGQKLVDCLPFDFNVRSRVHEYGGGAFTVSDRVIYFVNFKDQHLFRQPPGGTPELLAARDGYRYADLVLDGPRGRLLCVREDHTHPGEAINTLVAIPLGGGDEQVLAGECDFYSNPRLSPDGHHLAWLSWNHPNMPWDGCELWLAEIQPDGSLSGQERVAGGPTESVFQPEWSRQGSLHFVSDRSGWWNLYRMRNGVEPLCPREAEFGRPQWAFDMRTYACLSEDEILCTFTQNGMWRLARLDSRTKNLVELDLPYTDFSDLHLGPGFAVFEAGSATEPLSVIKLGLASGRTKVLQRNFKPTIDPGYFSVPQAVEFPTEHGLTAHGIFFPPANRDYAGPKGERPPLLVVSHGGPTAATSSALRYNVQYWTSRGFAVLDVNYGGSSGYGRAYRQRLNGNWGIVDVDDCCNGARWLAGQGRVDATRLAVRGGSAGGFTTLAALVFKDVFRAGASHYGIGDLEVFAVDTHKFESHYLESLVGPYPARTDLYHARSAIHFIQNMSAALILFQGSEDKVVPPNQAESMFAAVRAKGIPVAYLLFEGEQHGFRQAGNIKRSYEAELYFYSKVFKFDLAERIEPVRIENLEQTQASRIGE